jgi:hypothetical protein
MSTAVQSFRSGFLEAKGAMASIEIKLALPDALAREAEARGLLRPQAVERLISEEIRRGRVDRLFEAADRLAALPVPQLTEDELTSELEAARRTKRGGDAGDR